MSFIEKLTRSIEQNNSLLCVGLDPHPAQYPDHFPQLAEDVTAALVKWGQAIIEQTATMVCCYKPNFAFYEQYGPAGLEALRQTIAAVPEGIPVLLDAKRGDIGHTAAAYAKAAFEVWQADGITLNPYLGEDSISPFLAYPGKMVFVLCYTSNPSAQAMQEFGAETLLFEHVAHFSQQWASAEQLGFVVGATQPHALARVRALAPDRWFLAPGVGAQGGDVTVALTAGLDAQGQGMIVPVSRDVIYADDPAAAARHLRDHINLARQAVQRTSRSAVYRHAALINQLYEVGCVQFGEFTLASGQQSPVYIDLRRVTASPRLLRMVAQAYADMVRDLQFDHIAAVPYAALPMGTAISLTLKKPLIYPRKEAKSYGTGKIIEGQFAPGDSVVVIEDLVTSGGSVIKAIEQLQAADLKVQDVAVLIDRQQGGAENLTTRGYHLHAVLQLTDILSHLEQQGQLSAEQVARVKNYIGV